MSMSDIDIEIKNSPALSYIWHEMEQLEKRITELEGKKVCGQCGNKVPLSKWHLAYKESGEGVCEECWQKDYVPYMV